MTFDKKRFDKARMLKEKFSPMFDSIDRELSTYSQNSSQFQGFDFYMANDYASRSRNLEAFTGEPLLYIRNLASYVSASIYPLNDNSISLSCLSSEKNKELADTLSKIASAIQKIITNPTISFSSELSTAVLDAVKYGTCAMMIGGDDPVNPVIKAISFKQICFDYDSDMEINIIWRVYCDEDGKKVVEQYEKVADVSLQSRIPEKQWPIKYTKLVENDVVEEAMFAYWPIAIGQLYKEADSHYASGIGVSVLTNLKRMNMLQKMLYNACAMQVLPPVYMSSAMVQSRQHSKNVEEGISAPKLASTVYGPNKVFIGPSPTPMIHPMQTNIELNTLQVNIERQMNAIRKITLNDSMTLADISSNASIEEVMARIDIKLQDLTPIISGLNKMLNTIVLKLFSNLIISTDASTELDLPILSEEVFPLKIMYRTKFSQLADKKDLLAAMQSVSDIAKLAQLNPEVLDNINFDALMDKILEKAGMQDVQNSTAEVNRLREQRAQQAAMQQGQSADGSSGAM